MTMKFIFLLHIAFIFISFNSSAQAACSSPTGQASQTRYDFTANKLYYCNDTDWVEMGGSGGGGGSSVNVIDTYSAGGLTIEPVTGLEKWPDYISCPSSGMMYTLFLVRYSGSPQVIYQGTNSSLNMYFNKNGSYAGAANLAANCGTTDGHITSVCADGMCGYF